MNYQCKAETGAQLVARLGNRPNVKGIDQGLFFRDVSNSPGNGDTLEICGESSSGKTLFITQLLAQNILPAKVNLGNIEIHIGGHDAGAIIINTDHHFQISKVVQIMEQRFGDCFSRFDANPSKVNISREIEKQLEVSLKKLLILNCHNSAQLFATFHSLENRLSANRFINFLVLDSATAFYWQDVHSNNSMSKKMDSYLKSVVATLEKCIKGNNILTVYTRPKYFCSKNPINSKNAGSSLVGNYAIQLSHLDGEEGSHLSIGDEVRSTCFQAQVQSPNSSYVCGYMITPQGMMVPRKP